MGVGVEVGVGTMGSSPISAPNIIIGMKITKANMLRREFILAPFLGLEDTSDVLNLFQGFVELGFKCVVGNIELHGDMGA